MCLEMKKRQLFRQDTFLVAESTGGGNLASLGDCGKSHQQLHCLIKP